MGGPVGSRLLLTGFAEFCLGVGAEFLQVEKAIVIGVGSFEMLLPVMLGLHVEGQVFGEREFCIPAFVSQSDGRWALGRGSPIRSLAVSKAEKDTKRAAKGT